MRLGPKVCKTPRSGYSRLKHCNPYVPLGESCANVCVIMTERNPYTCEYAQGFFPQQEKCSAQMRNAAYAQPAKYLIEATVDKRLLNGLHRIAVSSLCCGPAVKPRQKYSGNHAATVRCLSLVICSEV